jgi:hypothetical protein
MVVLDDLIYAVTPAGTVATQVEAYNATADTWTMKTTMPEQGSSFVERSVVAGCQHKFYVINGFTGITMAYDPSIET